MITLQGDFDREARRTTDLAVKFILAARGEDMASIQEKRPLVVTEQFAALLGAEIYASLAWLAPGGETGLAELNGSPQTGEELRDIAKYYLGRHDKISPRFAEAPRTPSPAETAAKETVIRTLKDPEFLKKQQALLHRSYLG